MTVVRKKREKRYSMGPFSVKFGTVDKENPESVYVEGSVFISPVDDEEELYKKRVKRLSRALNGLVGEFAKKGNRFGGKYIFIFELAENGLKMGKRSYMFIQTILRQESVPIIDFLELDSICKDDLSFFVDEAVAAIENNGFEVFEARK